ncbi:universal stress protein [Zafaria sp. Z1313]|uniref:universal stress protein n=1 Tax=unclassified Zafaria TaxID=2828765 RepID=UPI002E78D464|nr:universal stress protein [Zafaria sp. J156]MEE1622133.1 universal stress protein [Zafaria sp. J156]
MSEEGVHQDIPPADGIVVGVDGSEPGNCALKWAAAEAGRRGVPLNIVTAYTIPVFAASSMDAGYAALDDQVIRDGAREVVDQARSLVADPDVEVRTRVESGDPAGVLLDLSTEADLVVVGTRGRGGFVGRLLGSVSSALPAHAKCPTVVVPLCVKDRDEGSPAVRDLVVVGVDGSERARLAVLVAAEQATARGIGLRVVCALPPISGSLAWMPATVDQEALQHDVRRQLAAGARWLASHFPELHIETDVLEGPPIEVLVRESETARLMVTGSRGRGGFAGMLLGSTSQGVLHHARGPVMVVPDREDPRLADRATFDEPDAA